MIHQETVSAATRLLRERGEAAAYVWLHLAAVVHLSQSNLLERLATLPGNEPPVWERLRALQAAIEQANGGELVFLPSTPPAETAEVDESGEETQAALTRQRGWWWLADSQPAAMPVSDRAEWATYTVLSTSQLATTQAIDRVVYALFPGLLTPGPGLIEACVQSYAYPVSPIHWQLRPLDVLAQRSQEHTEMLILLTNLGHRLGFRVWIGRSDLQHRQHGARLMELLSAAERYITIEEILPDADEHSQLVDMVWYQNRRAGHIFEVEWTAMLGESILRRGSRAPGLARFVAVPPERADLLLLKQESMPLLCRLLKEDGWQYIRFDALRLLAHAEEPSVADLGRICGLQPPENDKGVQLTLL